MLEKDRVAKRIRAFRKLKGYTQSEFAIIMGISLGILGEMERGTRTPDSKFLQRAAEVLEIEVDELTI